MAKQAVSQVVTSVIDDIYNVRKSEAEMSEVEASYVAFHKQISYSVRRGSLNLSQSRVGYGVLVRLPKLLRRLPWVHTLNLYGNSLRDEAIPRIAQILLSNPQITHLDIGALDLTDVSAAFISEMILQTKLVSLQLGRRETQCPPNWFTHGALNTIFDAVAQSTLVSFGIAGIGSMNQKKTQSSAVYPSKIANMIVNSRHLRNLDLSNCGLRDSSQQPLMECFKKSREMKMLNLKGNSFKKGTNLVGGIVLLHKLVSLNISDCGLSQSSVSVLAFALSRSWKLCHLDVSKNQIGSSGISALLLTAAKSNHLVSLNVASTNCDASIKNSFGMLIKQSTVLEYLNLSYNNLGDESALTIGDTLNGQSVLQRLYLNGCRITDTGAVHISNNLQSNSTLRRLHLKDNFISKQGGFLVLESLQKNQSLISIDLSSTQADCFCIESLSDLCKRNLETEKSEKLSNMRSKNVHLSIQEARIPRILEYLTTIKAERESTEKEIAILKSEIQTIVEKGTETIETLEDSTKGYEKLMKIDEIAKDEAKESLDGVLIYRDAKLNELKEGIQKETKLIEAKEKEIAALETEINSIRTRTSESKRMLEREIEEIVKAIEETKSLPQDEERLLKCDFAFEHKIEGQRSFIKIPTVGSFEVDETGLKATSELPKLKSRKSKKRPKKKN